MYRPPSAASWRLGAESAAPREVLEPDADWRRWSIDHERQNKGMETMACVSFSAANAVETHMRRLGLDVNWSDRALAKMSGTTRDGNYLDRVADTVRKLGMVPEDEWPFKPDDMTWDQFYRDIPADVLADARGFTDRWDVSYEFCWDDSGIGINGALKYGPVQVALNGHAMLLLHTDPKTGVRTVRDHYSQPLRELPAGTKFLYGLLWHVRPKKPMPSLKLVPNTLYQLTEPPGGFGLALTEDTMIVEQRWELLASWAVRGGGKFLTGTLTRAQWDSAGKRDLKGNAI
jgi:hypothetical protein